MQSLKKKKQQSAKQRRRGEIKTHSTWRDQRSRDLCKRRKVLQKASTTPARRSNKTQRNMNLLWTDYIFLDQSPRATYECPSCPSTMPPSRLKERERQSNPLQQKNLCEQVIKLLAEEELVRELFPPEEWRIHTSTEARDKGFQHERRLWVKNDLNALRIAKICQHAQDPTKSAGRSSFEEGFVSHVNSVFAELIQRTNRGGGRIPGEENNSGARTGVHGVEKGHCPQSGPKGASPHVCRFGT